MPREHKGLNTSHFPGAISKSNQRNSTESSRFFVKTWSCNPFHSWEVQWTKVGVPVKPSDWASTQKLKWKLLYGFLVVLLHSVQKVSFLVLSIHAAIWLRSLLKEMTGFNSRIAVRHFWTALAVGAELLRRVISLWSSWLALICARRSAKAHTSVTSLTRRTQRASGLSPCKGSCL